METVSDQIPVFAVSLMNEKSARFVFVRLPSIVGGDEELTIRTFLCHSTLIQLLRHRGSTPDKRGDLDPAEVVITNTLIY